MDQKVGSIFEALNGKIYGNTSSTQTLVLAHGFGSDQSVWHYLIPLVAYYFKVVVFDLAFSPNVQPGFYNPNKYSNYTAYANDLVSVLEELNIKRAIYLGLSMSAMIGCIAAVQNPQLFDQLILLGGSPRYLNDKGYKGGFNKSDIDTILREINQNYKTWVESFAPKAILVHNSNAISEFEHSLEKMSPSTTFSVAKTVFLSDWRSILPQVQVPTAIIQSKVDFIVPEFVADYMNAELAKQANVKVQILETQGHFPMLTAYPLLFNVLKNVVGIIDSVN